MIQYFTDRFAIFCWFIVILIFYLLFFFNTKSHYFTTLTLIKKEKKSIFPIRSVSKMLDLFSSSCYLRNGYVLHKGRENFLLAPRIQYWVRPHLNH